MGSRSTLLLTALALVVVPLAGCLSATPEDTDGQIDDTSEDLSGAIPDIDLNESPMNFSAHVVEPAVHFGHGLYEPTIDVSDSGVIYISSHTTGVDTTGAPAFYSDDDGESWQQLPFAGPAQMPDPGHGATPPPSDEIFIVAGDDGQAWGVDITLATFPVNGWCNDGGEHCYHNPDAYDEARAQTSRVEALTGEDESCSEANLNDRPWAAYANDTLLMVNNPGGGPVQVAAMDVPRPTYAEVWNPATGPTWNLCAGNGGGIPGIPGIRDDGFFAVPQMQGDNLVVVTGNAEDVMDVQQRTVFANSNVPVSETHIYGGQVVFDEHDTMFVAKMANNEETAGNDSGGIHVAVSTDDGRNFTDHTFRFDRPVSSVYIDGNEHGPGAVINWGLVEEEGEPTDWYLGHLHTNADGEPIITDVSLAVEDGPPASRHVQGAAAGPDGRAYMVMSEVTANSGAPQMAQHAGTTPLSVVVQQTGPTLPVSITDAVET